MMRHKAQAVNNFILFNKDNRRSKLKYKAMVCDFKKKIENKGYNIKQETVFLVFLEFKNAFNSTICKQSLEFRNLENFTLW